MCRALTKIGKKELEKRDALKVLKQPKHHLDGFGSKDLKHGIKQKLSGACHRTRGNIKEHNKKE